MTVLSGPKQITYGGGIYFVYVYPFLQGKHRFHLSSILKFLHATTLELRAIIAFSSDTENNLFLNICIVKSFTCNEKKEASLIL